MSDVPLNNIGEATEANMPNMPNTKKPSWSCGPNKSNERIRNLPVSDLEAN